MCSPVKIRFLYILHPLEGAALLTGVRRLSLRVSSHGLHLGICYAGDTLLHEAVSMSSRVGLTKPNDHIVVVQMISDSLVVKVCALLSCCAAIYHHDQHKSAPAFVMSCKRWHVWRCLGHNCSASAWQLDAKRRVMLPACVELDVCADSVFIVQILSVDELGEGIKPIRPQSLVDMMKVGIRKEASCHPCLVIMQGL